jgi:hypothetical protein
MSLEDGKKYLPYFGTDGFWHITTRGETGPLAKAFADSSTDIISAEHSYDNDNMIIEDFDSSITADEVFTKIAKEIQSTTDDENQSAAEPTQQEEKLNQEVTPPSITTTIKPAETIHPMRRITRSIAGIVSPHYKDSLVAKTHQLFITALTNIGYNITASEQAEPDLSNLITTSAISHD